MTPREIDPPGRTPHEFAGRAGAISRFFIERPVLSNVIALVVVLVGLVALMNLPSAQYPNVVPPTVQVTTRYPGASARTLVDSVALPIFPVAPLPRHASSRRLAESIDFAHLAEARKDAGHQVHHEVRWRRVERPAVHHPVEGRARRSPRLGLPADHVPGDRDRRRALLGRRLRLNEISFNSPLMKELRMIALLRQVADPGSGEGARWAGMRTHRIMTDRLAELGASSKLNAEREFLMLLKEEGRRSADAFLAAHGEDIGKRSTTDLDALLEEC